MSKKPKYSIDQDNNLRIEDKGRKISAQGKFSTDKNNRLIYWLNAPCAWRRKYRLGKTFVLEGKWRLNANHDLELQLDKSDLWQKDSVLALKGDVISAENDKLVFQIRSRDNKEQAQVYLLKLNGYWRADKYNRINFVVKKSGRPADILLLSGSWQVNQNQRIVYTFEKENLKTKTKTLHKINFNGYWQINAAQRLTYILSADSRSRFDFRYQVESPNLYPAQGVIKYRLGAGVRESRLASAPRTVYLYGIWKFSRKFEMSFHMDYGQGRVQKILFGTQIKINKKNEIAVSLHNSRNEALGMQVIFTHRFLKKLDAQTFLRLEARDKERAAKAGVRIPF